MLQCIPEVLKCPWGYPHVHYHKLLLLSQIQSQVGREIRLAGKEPDHTMLHPVLVRAYSLCPFQMSFV